MMKLLNWSDKGNGWNNLKHVLVRETFRYDNITPDEVYKLWKRCWSREPHDRPSFAEILDFLNGIQGQQTAKVDSLYQEEFDSAYQVTAAKDEDGYLGI